MQITAFGWQSWAEQWFSCHQCRSCNAVYRKGSPLLWENHVSTTGSPATDSFHHLRVGYMCGRKEKVKAALTHLSCINGTRMLVWKWTEKRRDCPSHSISPSSSKMLGRAAFCEWSCDNPVPQWCSSSTPFWGGEFPHYFLLSRKNFYF